jgi:hypothetical protein
MADKNVPFFIWLGDIKSRIRYLTGEAYLLVSLFFPFFFLYPLPHGCLISFTAELGAALDPTATR